MMLREGEHVVELSKCKTVYSSRLEVNKIILIEDYPLIAYILTRLSFPLRSQQIRFVCFSFEQASSLTRNSIKVVKETGILSYYPLSMSMLLIRLPIHLLIFLPYLPLG